MTSHPIQYYAPWFRELAQKLELEVFYCHRQSPADQAQAGFGVEFEWDIPLLEGYPYQWLDNVAAQPGVGRFGGCDTPEIQEIIRSGSFDVFLVFGWNYKSALQAVAACWREGVPVLMRGDSILETSRPLWLRAAKWLPYRAILPRIAGHLYVGERNRRYLEHYGVDADRLCFCPHFVDVARFRNSLERSRSNGKTRQLRRQLDLSDNSTTVLFVGKLIKNKRPEDVVRAVSWASERLRGGAMRAVIVGDGPLRGGIEALARSLESAGQRCSFVGFVNQAELPTYYSIADYLCLPSSETWGLVVNEALACGVPVLVSEQVGSAPDLVEPGRTGYTFPHGQIEAMVNLLIRASKEGLGRRDLDVVAIEEKCLAYSMDMATEGLLGAIERVTSAAF